MRLMTTTALLAALIGTPALATDITIENFVGKITIIQGNDGLDVIQNGKGDLQYRQNGETITVDGGLNSKERGDACKGPGGSWNLSLGSWNSTGDTRLDDYPELEISVASGSDLTITRSAVEIVAEADLGETRLDVSGCFDIELADTASLTIDKSGSGDITAGSTGPTRIEKSGSGDIEIIEAASFDLEQSGSGDIDIEAVTGPVDIDKSGSGDVEIERLTGSLSVDKSGSGDVEVDGGEVSVLTVSNSGSGDVNVHADIGDAKINASGSGDIYVKSISGSLEKSISGSADLNRGDD